MTSAHALPNVFVLFHGQTCGKVRQRAQDQNAEMRKSADFMGLGWWAVTGSNRRPSRCKRENGFDYRFKYSALRALRILCPHFSHGSTGVLASGYPL